MQFVQIARLALALLMLHEQHTSILLGHKGGLQRVLLLVGLALEDVHGQLHHLVAMCGIDIRGLQDAVAHTLDAASCRGQGVDATETGLLAALLFQGLAGSNGHAVVLTEHEIYFRGLHRLLFQEIVHGFLAALLGPVALQRAQQADARITAQGLNKTCVAFNGGRRAFQSHDFHHITPSAQAPGHIVAHLLTHQFVVGSDVGRIFLRTGLAVEHDDGNALVERTVDGRCDGGHLVRRHDEQVDAVADELVYLVDLLLVVVASGDKAKLGIVERVGAHAQLIVQLVAPDILRALRHTDDIMLRVVVASAKKEPDYKQQTIS